MISLESGPPERPGPKTIFLRDLPPELNPGCRVPLTPLGALSHRLSSCDACGVFTPKRILSSCGHTFCFGCCMAVENADGIDLRCYSCKEICCGSVTEMNERVLRTLKFACRCGLEGNLAEIKDHLWKGEVEHEDINRTVGAGLPVPPVPRTISTASSGPTSENKGFFWMQVLDLSTQCQKTGMAQRSDSGQEWKASGYVFELLAQVQPGSDKDLYVALMIRLPVNKPSAFAWPVKKKLIVSIHSTEGKPVSKKEVLTFENGKVISDVFLAPSSTKYYVIDRLSRIKELENASAISRDGFVCFSVDVQPILH
ncbi:uncharacterized protein LOC111247068 [Varroa destructor]|uniref:RING-type domain-containing protein n=1 Tax=Varroa destructor TaxID=109461 RepID=A0A7M7JVY4_VARDE|nr:uncharacterized protein LOC111247068 [Varroa destructor]